ncbi:DUF4199 domain-containing protein [Fodinibius halophilus]|uniref:DUF4199 domain-containing protein n=1 Tax=Fodinibius halophilus TaxID=1736908 RepID=A0A6M1T854_9BACT|nr:DUF4199 domain-containing protein [Fodinibius halophilus]NGP89635.1 DUF4199 domain-containing protein [Fodinibius halophilus]
MEESQQQTVNEQPSYWTSVGIAALIFGILYFAISLIGGYAMINSEPSGSMFGNMNQTVSSSIACLVGICGAILAIWHYSKTYGGLSITLGKGALIGLYVAIATAIVVTVLNQFWNVIDPTYTERLMDSMIANFEAMEGVPEGQKQQMVDSIASEFKNSNTLWGITKGFLMNTVILGIGNLITGMIGAKIFGKDEG